MLRGVGGVREQDAAFGVLDRNAEWYGVDNLPEVGVGE